MGTPRHSLVGKILLGPAMASTLLVFACRTGNPAFHPNEHSGETSSGHSFAKPGQTPSSSPKTTAQPGQPTTPQTPPDPTQDRSTEQSQPEATNSPQSSSEPKLTAETTDRSDNSNSSDISDSSGKSGSNSSIGSNSSASSKPSTSSISSSTSSTSNPTDSPSSSDSSSTSFSTSESSASGTNSTESGAAAQYCNRGSIACYRMDAVDKDRFLDSGNLGRHIPAQNATTVSYSAPNYPFNHLIDFERKVYTSEGNPFSNPKTMTMGFDVWLKPDKDDDQGWASFEIDNFISLSRNDSSSLQCDFSTNPALGAQIRVNFTFVANKAHHIACAIDTSGMYMWIDGKKYTKTDDMPSSHPKSSSYNFGWLQITNPPFSGSVGALRVWEDVVKMKAEISGMF